MLNSAGLNHAYNSLGSVDDVLLTSLYLPRVRPKNVNFFISIWRLSSKFLAFVTSQETGNEHGQRTASRVLAKAIYLYEITYNTCI